MIIERILAENVLKYARLDLDSIPSQGLIAIVGDNESGKSSIGEAVCFALFGRTFSLGPDELSKVIRWGESRCSIRLDFRTPDGGRYQVARFLDELGNHGASISRPGEQPMVRGVKQVAERLRELIGFGYTELIESFYLAQREISTPKPHSDAVKAMAGIDALERVSAECLRERDQAEAQRTETRRAQAEIEAQIGSLDLDPERLGALEGDQARTRDALAADRKHIVTLKAGAEAADKALARVKEGVASWSAIEARASHRERQAQAEALAEVLAAIGPTASDDEATRHAYANLAAEAQAMDKRIAAFARFRGQIDRYRARLGTLLGLGEAADPSPDAGAAASIHHGSRPYAAQFADLDQRTRQTRRRRLASRLWGFVAALVGLGLAWVWWILMQGEPAQIAHRLTDAMESLLGGWRPALPWMPGVAGALAALAIGLFALAARQKTHLIQHARARAALDHARHHAEQEYADLGHVDAQPLPELIARLADTKDHAVAAALSEFIAGPGGDLADAERLAGIRQEFKARAAELAACLTRVKAQSGQTIDALHERVARRTAEIAGREEQIAQEQARIRRHAELTTIADGLHARAAALEHRARLRDLAIDLLAGAIHYIAQRFNTEVRNLCADSLPKFTNGRYRHLQIDQDLKVKAFSADKHDFMDLDEISSGTQRQIMLAVRLALSQKLVNSVIQGPQFLFLDEPFAFFDESRTASALAVLPQVSRDFTQIWVTSQTFPAASRFDLVVECNARESESPSIRRFAADSEVKDRG